MVALAKKYVALPACFAVLCLSFSPVSAQDRGLEEINCAVTPDQIVGQAFSGTAGAAGETGEGGLTPEGEDIVAGELAASAEWIMRNLPYATPGTAQVAILVADDFSSDGAGDTPASHGWLVWEVFEGLLALLPQENAGSILLEQVNIADEAGYRSDLILPAIQSAVEELSAQGISRYVLNMSFTFVPCQDSEIGFSFTDFVEARRNNPGRSLVEHLGADPQAIRAILADSRVSYIDETGLASTQQEGGRGSQSLTAPADTGEVPPTPSGETPPLRGQDLQVARLFNNPRLQNDPLRDFLRQSRRELIIIPVASAGNFKQRQPFYPARWPEVISVSANEGNNLRFWLHSNNGDVSAPGAWFLLEDEQYRAGTSFAAPVVSVLVALDLTQSEPSCGLQGNRPALARGAYDNQLIGEAVAQYCR
jgi:hypothetical protein